MFEGLVPVLNDRRPGCRRYDAARGLSQREAAIFYGEEKLAQSVWMLERSGYEAPPAMIGDDGWPLDLEETNEHRTIHFRLERQRRSLQSALLRKLRAGDLVASGFSPHSAIDEPAALIAVDRWRVLTPDFERSQASGPGGVIEGILVFSGERASAPDRLAKARFALAEVRAWYQR